MSPTNRRTFLASGAALAACSYAAGVDIVVDGGMKVW